MNYSRIVFYYSKGAISCFRISKVSKSKANLMIGFYHPILVIDKNNNIIEYSNKSNDEKLSFYYSIFCSSFHG